MVCHGVRRSRREVELALFVGGSDGVSWIEAIRACEYPGRSVGRGSQWWVDTRGGVTERGWRCSVESSRPPCDAAYEKAEMMVFRLDTAVARQTCAKRSVVGP